MKTFLIASLLFLSACSGQNIIRTNQFLVVMPEESMFTCERFTNFPRTETLTDIQVARMLVELYELNSTCKNSIDSIRAFLEEARRINANTDARAGRTND
jgi:hypothetical protein